ncbi:MAG: hypothetical protein JNJ86_00560 [Chitinophagaceae bacterium]|nr:hypothetical protein [Chitinophagaceae bacterium]
MEILTAMQQHCFFCNQTNEPVHVHGHYQCPVCHINILPCCDGDNCETNHLLQTKAIATESIIPSVSSPNRITGGFE